METLSSRQARKLSDQVWLPLTVIFVLTYPAFAAELPSVISWVGNSFSGKNYWVLQDCADLCVLRDGTLFTNTIWDEGGDNVEQYLDGKVVAVARHTHGWGYEGGDAVAANSRYLYIAQTVGNSGGHLSGESFPPKGSTWSGVSRRLRSDIKKPAPFPGGVGDPKKGDLLGFAFLPVETLPEQSRDWIKGLAASEARLYVSCPKDNQVRVYDAETMQPVATIAIESPQHIALDASERLWVLHQVAGQGKWEAACFDGKSNQLQSRTVFEPSVIANAICFDRRGRMYVCDGGPDQQIKVFDGGQQVEAIGAKGGILAGPTPGRFGDLRFNRPCAVGMDAADNLYVASGGSSAWHEGASAGSTVIECYSPEHKCKWRVFGLEFLDMATLDASTGADAYTKEEHFALDWRRPAGQEWTYGGFTVDRYKYPDDPRLHTLATTPYIRQIGGSKFLFASDAYGDCLGVYRFSERTDGEIAIPCAFFSNGPRPTADHWPAIMQPRGEWMWSDRNGDGRIDADEYRYNGIRKATGIAWPDEAGAVWQNTEAVIRKLPMTGLDAHGVPQWDFATAKTWPIPPEFDQVRRLHYLPKDDVMLLGGNKGDLRNQHWKPMGPVLCCYDHWSAGASLRWRLVLPYTKGAEHHESREPISFDVAGDYLFVAYTRGLPEDGIKFAFVKVYGLSDGGLVGNLVPETQIGEGGLLDLVQSAEAARRSDGEYVVFMEEDMKAKVIMIRWHP